MKNRIEGYYLYFNSVVLWLDFCTIIIRPQGSSYSIINIYIIEKKKKNGVAQMTYTLRQGHYIYRERKNLLISNGVSLKNSHNRKVLRLWYVFPLSIYKSIELGY